MPSVRRAPAVLVAIALAAGVLAPFVLLENGLVRMWYLAPSGGEEDFVIGYAESSINAEGESSAPGSSLRFLGHRRDR